MARRALWAVAGLGTLALGAGAYLPVFPLPSGDIPAVSAASAQASGEPREAQATVVEVQQVARDTVVDDIRAVGTLLPNEQVEVSPEIAGRVAAIRFAEGDRVAAGDVLVELDATILRAEMDKARSDLTLAAANRERAVTLASQGTGTLRARDEAIAAHLAAQAEVALAQARLEKTAIAAPFDGTVGLRSVSVGAYVTPGDRLVQLVDLDPIKVDFRVPELALGRLATGQRINVTVDAVPGQSFEGRVYAIDPIVDANGRAVRLRARIDNPERRLSPGLFARVQIVVERRRDSLLIPESAVFAEGQRRLVYRVAEARAELVEVTLGQRRPGQVEVLSGLAADDVVVAAGHQKLRDGAPVEAAPLPPDS